MTGSSVRRQSPSIAESLQEYGRGVAGGLMFSVPLLYTMEMWWAGFNASPFRLAGLLAFTYVLLLGYNRAAGMHRDATWPEVAVDSVEELGLALVTAAAILYLIGRIGTHTSLSESLGKIVMEAAVVAIGFSIGTAQLHARNGGEEGGEERGLEGFGGELMIAFCGAVLFAANIAPTEEIQTIALETGPFRLLALGGASLVLAAVILYFSNFMQSGRVMHRHGLLDMVLGSGATYAVALVASGLILWYFGRFDGAAPEFAVRQIVVLGLPAALGASAGRLLLTP